MIDRAISKLKTEGIFGVARAVRRRLLPRSGESSAAEPVSPVVRVADSRPDFPECFESYQDRFLGKKGLEIGGPSGVFARDGIFPVYPLVGRLDNCNFSRNTIWEGKLEAGLTFQFDPEQPPGWQYLSEAVDLSEIVTGTYDFVLSSHMLEHTANPLRALCEWKRVIREGGTLVFIVPRPEGTFDHCRPVTPLAHLVEDFERGTREDDLTHLPEILKLHDLTRDPWAGDLEAFKTRSQRNFENRCLHHHVFSPRLVEDILDYVGFQIKAVEESLPIHIFGIAEKLKAGQVPRNAAVAPHLRNSPVVPLRARVQAS